MVNAFADLRNMAAPLILARHERRRQGATAGERLSTPQHIAMLALADGPRTMSSLAAATGVALSTATRMVQTLEREGVGGATGGRPGRRPAPPSGGPHAGGAPGDGRGQRGQPHAPAPPARAARARRVPGRPRGPAGPAPRTSGGRRRRPRWTPSRRPPRCRRAPGRPARAARRPRGASRRAPPRGSAATAPGSGSGTARRWPRPRSGRRHPRAAGRRAPGRAACARRSRSAMGVRMRWRASRRLGAPTTRLWAASARPRSMAWRSAMIAMAAARPSHASSVRAASSTASARSAQPLLDHREDQVVLAREAAEDRRVPHPGPARELVDREVGAGLGEELRRGRQDQLPVAARVGAERASHRSPGRCPARGSPPRRACARRSR